MGTHRRPAKPANEIDLATPAAWGTPPLEGLVIHELHVHGYLQGRGYRVIASAGWTDRTPSGRPSIVSSDRHLYEVQVTVPLRARPSLGDLMGILGHQLHLMALEPAVLAMDGQEALPGL